MGKLAMRRRNMWWNSRGRTLKNLQMLTLKHSHYFLIGLLSMSIFTGACVDRIDFARPQTLEDAIAIQGRLVKGNPSRVNVTIRKVLDYKSAPRFVKVHSVTLIDDLGNTIDLETKAEGIYYQTIREETSTSSISTDRTYKIKVETFSNLIFESEFEGIVSAPTPTDLSAHRIKKEGRNVIGDIILRDDFIGFAIETPLEVSPNSGNVKILWEIESTHKVMDYPGFCGYNRANKTCYVTSSPIASFVPLDGTQLSVNSISDTIYEAFIHSPVFADGYYLTVQQQAVTDKTFEYWSQVQVVNSREGSIFEAPAGKIITNIKNLTYPEEEAFGYFYATEEKPIRVYVPPELAENPKADCPRGPNNNGEFLAEECCNCLMINGATTEKPDWWK